MTATTSKYRIHAFLRTLSPMHITSPESARLDVAAMKVVYGDSMGIPLNQVQKLNVAEIGGSSRSVPVIAANNIMGRLRRHGATKILDALRAKGEKVAVTTYSALQCGAATGKPDGRDVQFTEYREARQHPYIGLFGGGPRMMRRYVRCFNAVPYMDCTAFMAGRTKHPYLDEAVHKAPSDSRRLTQYWIQNRNDDLRELVNIGQAQDTIKDFEKEINERQQAILADSKANSEGADSTSRHSTRSFSSLEFVVPGVYFPLCFELDVTEAQMGLFLLALDSFAATERLGGHARNGLGLFSLSDVLITDDKGTVLAGKVFSDSRLDQAEAFVQPLLQAWAREASAISGADLDRLFAPPVDEAKGKKSAKAKAAEAV
ncbi:type IV CRISPR-associated protein Csf2 [Acidovorax sp.]|uniref:type IV CRISPR-associated protein Csf2 n=1 Tax=Acidovorax sp. TaxID=1872122 RepID=UPI00391F1D88